MLGRLDAELGQAIGAVREERVAVLAALDDASNDAVERSRMAARDVVDHAFWRALQLLLVAAMLYFGIRLLIGRMTRSPSGGGR